MKVWCLHVPRNCRRRGPLHATHSMFLSSQQRMLRVLEQNFDADRMEPYLREDSTFKIEIDTWGHTFSQQQTMDCIGTMAQTLPFKVAMTCINPVFSASAPPPPPPQSCVGAPQFQGSAAKLKDCWASMRDGRGCVGLAKRVWVGGRCFPHLCIPRARIVPRAAVPVEALPPPAACPACQTGLCRIGTDR